MTVSVVVEGIVLANRYAVSALTPKPALKPDVPNTPIEPGPKPPEPPKTWEDWIKDQLKR